MKKSILYKNLPKKQVQCLCCGHFCVIKNNKAGICGARKNINGELDLLVYGYPSDLNADPIEKKPFYHFKPGSYAYSFGTFGCNLKCKNCFNWAISQDHADMEKRRENLNFISPERIIENALGDGCESIAYTYNEPTVSLEYALEVMKLAQQNGLKNIWVSNGYMSSQALDAILPYLDAANVDLKSFSEDFYKENCQAGLGPILKNLVRLKQEQVHLEITTLIIPGKSSGIEMLASLSEFIAAELDSDTPWHISKFFPHVSWKLKDLPPTGEDMIYEAYEIGKSAGLKYVYVGNLPGDQKENTYCPKCGELAIRRFGSNIDRLDNSGRCAYCDRDLDIIE